MTKELRDLIEKNRGRVLTPAEFEVQVRSSAYGNLALSEPGTSRAAVDRACDVLFASLR